MPTIYFSREAFAKARADSYGDLQQMFTARSRTLHTMMPDPCLPNAEGIKDPEDWEESSLANEEVDDKVPYGEESCTHKVTSNFKVIDNGSDDELDDLPDVLPPSPRHEDDYWK